MTIRKSRHVENGNFAIRQQLRVRRDEANIRHHKETFDDVIEMDVIEVVADQAENDDFVVVGSCFV
jgi:hypothetical protein